MTAEPSQEQINAAVSACNDLIQELPFYVKKMIDNDMIYKVAYACASAVVQVGEEEKDAKPEVS